MTRLLCCCAALALSTSAATIESRGRGVKVHPPSNFKPDFHPQVIIPSASYIDFATNIRDDDRWLQANNPSDYAKAPVHYLWTVQGVEGGLPIFNMTASRPGYTLMTFNQHKSMLVSVATGGTARQHVNLCFVRLSSKHGMRDVRSIAIAEISNGPKKAVLCTASPDILTTAALSHPNSEAMQSYLYTFWEPPPPDPSDSRGCCSIM